MGEMTNEQAIRWLKDLLKSDLPMEQYQTAIEKGIEALEQEPCDDCISREASICLADELKDGLPDDDRLSDMVMSHNEGILEYQTKLSLLPPVTPQPKTGHWINGKCDRCGTHAPYWAMATTYYCSEYCPNCGTRMVEPSESEDLGDYPDTISNQFDNMTGSMNL